MTAVAGRILSPGWRYLRVRVRGHPEPRIWATRVSIGRKSVVTTFKPRGRCEAVGQLAWRRARERSCPSGFKPPGKRVQSGAALGGRPPVQCRARGFHGSKDKVLLVFRLLLKKPTDRPRDRLNLLARDHYYLFFSSRRSVGYLVDVDAMGLPPCPLLSLSLSLSPFACLVSAK